MTSIPKCEVCTDCEPDIILEASDGTRFGVSAGNLHKFSGAFPAQGFDKADALAPEVVVLPETAHVVRLMVRFMHPRVSQPNIWDIEEPWQLAEAVEKYEIFTAQQVVKARMRSLAAMHPVQIYIYATRNGHDDLLDDVEKHIGLADYRTIERPLQLLYAEAPWIPAAFHVFRERYRENALSIAMKLAGGHKEPRDRMNTHPNSAGTDVCGWDKCWTQWSAVVRPPARIIDFQKEYDRCWNGFDCWYCQKAIWKVLPDGMDKVFRPEVTLKHCVNEARKAGK
ncbi:hypothetical protein C8F01DRAFT_1165521 [Mycena amicta]|nr:hypothetical protein C8F01DRAFT_1165521 [Mycena amicta]